MIAYLDANIVIYVVEHHRSGGPRLRPGSLNFGPAVSKLP